MLRNAEPERAGRAHRLCSAGDGAGRPRVFGGSGGGHAPTLHVRGRPRHQLRHGHRSPLHPDEQPRERNRHRRRHVRLRFPLGGRRRGGPAISSVLACAGFGSVSGGSVTAIVTMAPICMPAMRRFQYVDSLAAGSSATSRSPPLIPFVIATLFVVAPFIAFPGVVMWLPRQAGLLVRRNRLIAGREARCFVPHPEEPRLTANTRQTVRNRRGSSCSGVRCKDELTGSPL